MFRFCWHKWSNWSAAKDIYRGYGSEQISKCSKCGALKTRQFSSDQNVTSKIINDAVNNDKEMSQ